MVTLLVAVTCISLATTAVLAVVTWRVVRRDRARSAARVAALAAAADALDALDSPTSRQVESRDGRPQSDEGTGAPDGPAGAGLFAAVQRSSSPRGSMLTVAAAGVVVVGLVAMALAARGRVAAAGASRGAAGTMPLELVALRATRADDTLAIEGLVRNPASAPRRDGTRVVAAVVNGQGLVVARLAAPLDVAALLPGDESPFVLRARAAPEAVRLRLSFRAADGALVPHADRRARNARTGEAADRVRQTP